MLVKTILNRCYKFKRFVYDKVKFNEEKDAIEVTIIPRKNGVAVCSCCHNEVSALYDKSQKPRRFEFIAIWGFAVYFLYCMRRVDCKGCGVKVEMIPWAKGKNTVTLIYMQFLAHWAKKLSWKEVARSFNTTWEKVCKAVKYIVDWGLKNRDLSKITAIGVDEVQWQDGHKYLTLVYQIDSGITRLLWIAKERTEKTFNGFFSFLGNEATANLKFICSDMWKPYLKVIREKAKNAMHILDRFHIVSMLNKAIDKIRADEYKKMTADGYEPILKKSRWCLLKRQENLTEKQEVKLKDILKYNLKSVRAYLLKEDFQGFWEYVSPAWADKFLKRWCTRVMRSKIEPLKKIVKSLRKHNELILNWFRAKKRFSSGIVEGLNNKVKVTMRKSYGFRTFDVAETALYHVLGALPEPQMTHRFY